MPVLAVAGVEVLPISAMPMMKNRATTPPTTDRRPKATSVGTSAPQQHLMFLAGWGGFRVRSWWLSFGA